MTHRMIHHTPSPLLMSRSMRPRAPPSLSYRFIIASSAVLAFFLPFLLSYFSLADLDVCVIDRFPSPTKPSPLPPSTLLSTPYLTPTPYNDTLPHDPLLDPSLASLEAASDSVAAVTERVSTAWLPPTTIMLACLIACCLIKSFLPSTSHPHLSALRFLDLLKVLLAYMWYLAAYFTCNALKGYMGDSRCNVHANSISGHYLFHLYSGLALLHLHAQQTHATVYSVVSPHFYARLFHSNVSKLFMFVFICYSLLSAIILMNTYLHGYHSLRQILYGVAMALVSHWAMMEVLDMLDDMTIHHFDMHSTDTQHRSSTSQHPLSSSALMRKRTLHPSPTLGRASSASGGSGASLLELSPSPAQVGSALVANHAPMAPRYVSGFSPFQRLLWYAVQYSTRMSEERGLFFVFPFVLILALQVVGFVLLLLSPSNDLWRGLDVAVVAAIWLVLLYLYTFHLHLPVAVKRDSPRSATATPAVAVPSA